MLDGFPGVWLWIIPASAAAAPDDEAPLDSIFGLSLTLSREGSCGDSVDTGDLWSVSLDISI